MILAPISAYLSFPPKKIKWPCRGIYSERKKNTGRPLQTKQTKPPLQRVGYKIQANTRMKPANKVAHQRHVNKNFIQKILQNPILGLRANFIRKSKFE